MGEDRVNQCTAVTELFVDGALMILRAGLGQSGVPQWSSPFALCELADKHGEAHADLIGVSMDESDGESLWLLWTEDGKSMVWRPWCTVESEDGEGCGLYLAHPGAHAWGVTDPTMEAVLAMLREEE